MNQTQGQNHIIRTALQGLLLWLLAATAQAASQMYFVHTDHLGTPQVLTDSDQQVVWEGHQTPFGELVSEQGSTTQPMRFPGQYADPETGFSYNYFRDYDPTLGRCVQSDPVGLRGGVNTFGYTLQNPIKYTDPKGLAVPAAAVACAANPFCREASRRTKQACANLAGAARSIWGAWNEANNDASNNPHPADPNPNRKPKQDKPLSEGGKEIEDLKKSGNDPHDLKPGAGYDVFKDKKGNVYVKLKVVKDTASQRGSTLMTCSGDKVSESICGSNE